MIDAVGGSTVQATRRTNGGELAHEVAGWLLPSECDSLGGMGIKLLLDGAVLSGAAAGVCALAGCWGKPELWDAAAGCGVLAGMATGAALCMGFMGVESGSSMTRHDFRPGSSCP